MDLKTGDRVTVKIDAKPAFDGVIIGEARGGHAWLVVKDGTKYPRGLHKDFCRPVTAKTGTRKLAARFLTD